MSKKILQMLQLLEILILICYCNAGNFGYGTSNMLPQSDSVYTANAEEFVSSHELPVKYAPQSKGYSTNTMQYNYNPQVMVRNDVLQESNYQPSQENYDSHFLTDMEPHPVTDFKPHPVTDFKPHRAVFHSAQQSTNYNYLPQNSYSSQSYGFYPNQNFPRGQHKVYKENTAYGQSPDYSHNFPYEPGTNNGLNYGYDQNSIYNQNTDYGQNTVQYKNEDYTQNAGYRQNLQNNQNVGYGQDSDNGQNYDYGKSFSNSQSIQAQTLGDGAYIPGAGFIPGYPFVYMRDSYNGHLPPGVEESNDAYNSPKSNSDTYFSHGPTNSYSSNTYFSQENRVPTYSKENRSRINKISTLQVTKNNSAPSYSNQQPNLRHSNSNGY